MILLFPAFLRKIFTALLPLPCAFALLGQESGPPQPAPAVQVEPAAVPVLSPKAAYDEALHPLDLTRRSIGNWSGAEVTALTVSIGQARSACQARSPRSYAGADLIDLARLCALGQEWSTVVLTTSLYIDTPAAAKPLLPEAHAARVDADLHLKSQPDAVRDTEAMYKAVPYSPIVAEASGEAIDYMRFSTPDEALALAMERQPLVLAQLKKLTAPPLPVAPANPSTAATPPPAPQASRFTLHDLYAQGLVLADLQQLADEPELAQKTLAELDQALPATMPADDNLLIAQQRKRYALLGKKLPDVALRRSLSMPYDLPAIPALNTMTVLLLFPDWCAQCIAAVGQLPETVFRIGGHDAYYYGLLAETVPERKPETALNAQQLVSSFDPAFASSLLAEKPVVTVPPLTLEQFAAADFPFLLVTDPQGFVRVALPVDADDLASGGKVDAAVVVVGQHWPVITTPRPGSPPASAPAEAPASQ